MLPHWNDRGRHTRELIAAVLAAADPQAAVRRCLRLEGDTLRVGAQAYHLPDYRRLLVIGFGKASATMAQAVEDVLGNRITGGAVVTKYGHGAPLTRIEVAESGHPLPDEAGVRAARQLLDLVGQATPDDLILALVSGGGSALLVYPAEGVSLADLQAVNEGLLHSGATIDEFNAVRKHLSRVKGGGLARKLAPASVAALILSDVVGNPLDVIASGPLSPDPTTFADAERVLREAGLWDGLPEGVLWRLQRGLSGQVPETPKPGDPIFENVQTLVAGDNALAARGTVERAVALGFNAQLLTTFLEGEAREVARVAIALAREIAATDRPVARPACLVLGGETTVTVRGEGRSPSIGSGLGGRNQELALAAAIRMAEAGLRNVRVICLATDGGDGPTDAAGALADADTLQRAAALGLDARDHLARNAAYPFFAALGDLIRTGPTGTNVNDVLMILVYSSTDSPRGRGSCRRAWLPWPRRRQRAAAPRRSPRRRERLPRPG